MEPKILKNTFIPSRILSIKGISKEIMIPFSFTFSNNQAEFKGTFFTNRIDFGLGKNT